MSVSKIENLMALRGSDASPITIEAEWESLFRSMNYWIEYSQEQGMPVHLINLVKEASYFAHRFKRFFDDVPPHFYNEQDTTPFAALHQARERVVSEWDTIQQALEQRLSPRYHDGLDKLDKLAQECLQPILSQAEAQKATTYFHKVYDITRFAFSQAPMIGAPYSALHLPESWLAIPHEAGHYIFWNGATSIGDFGRFQSDLEEAVLQSLVNNTEGNSENNIFRRKRMVYNTWLAWLEELFADIYSTLVSGPVSGWGMQASLRTRADLKSLDEDDGEHPAPYLRPFIHITTLRQMAELTDGPFATELTLEADRQEQVWRDSWPSDIGSRLQTPHGRGMIETMIVQDLPLLVHSILQVPLSSPTGTPVSLSNKFQADAFYSEEKHDRILEAVEKLLTDQQVTFVSELEMVATAQLAITTGQNAEQIRHGLGFRQEAYMPDDSNMPDTGSETLDIKFDEYLKGITGADSEAEQQKAWDLVVESNLSTGGGLHSHWNHHHPHSH